MSDFDLIDDPAPGQNAPEFSVSEISGAVKRQIESNFSRVRVRGEVGRVSRPRSGHVYLDLKDERAVLSGVMWKGVAARQATQPEEGMEVVATGKLTTFPGQSKYQIVIDQIAPAGVGALMAMLEKRKAALSAEGLFAPERKKPLPFLPEVIGVVTSPSGAVIRDILHRLRDRFPRRVLIWPVAVQGEKCAPEVARAIRGFNMLTPGGTLPRPDLIIVARGGGSLEDLWGFNEEEVVRAAAESELPLISAVGHETDTTLIDFASDVRAPTPTAAAELAVPVRLELIATVDSFGARSMNALTQNVTRRRQRLNDLGRALPKPDDLTSSSVQRLDFFAGRLPTALQTVTQKKRVKLAELTAVLRPGVLRDRHDARKRAGSVLGARLRSELLSLLQSRSNERLVQLSARFERVSNQQVEGWKRRLETADRVRLTVGYQATLKRGYAVVRSGENVLTTRAAAAGAANLEIEFQDGRLALAPDKAKKSGNKPSAPEQGSLF